MGEGISVRRLFMFVCASSGSATTAVVDPEHASFETLECDGGA